MEKVHTNIAQALGLSFSGPQVSIVPPELVATMADEVLPLLEKATEFSHGEMTAVNILNMVYLGHMHLACLFVDGRVTLACVMQLQDNPSYRVAQVVALGGSRLLLARRFFPWLCFWASLHECVAVEAWTRPQMTRALKRYGFQKKCDVISFSLKGFHQ